MPKRPLRPASPARGISFASGARPSDQARRRPSACIAPAPNRSFTTSWPLCPLDDWMHTTVTPLQPHPNDPTLPRPSSFQLPDPRLTPVYRLEATVGEPMEIGDTAHGRRRIVPLTGGSFTGPAINGALLPGASADWQTVLPDGTALGDVRYTLRTDGGDVLYVQARGVRHGSAEVLARLARGEDVDASEYTFRTSTQIETAAAELDWLNKGVFVSVGGRRPGGVVYETYLVQ